MTTLNIILSVVLSGAVVALWAFVVAYRVADREAVFAQQEVRSWRSQRDACLRDFLALKAQLHQEFGTSDVDAIALLLEEFARVGMPG